jgi:hypothetical protein
MTTNHRFYLNEDNRIIDKLNPANNEKAEWHEQLGYPKNEESFRVLLLWRRLGELVHDLIINTNPLKKLHNGKKYQSVNEEAGSIWTALYQTIIVSHLHTLDVALSVQHKFGGELRRKKKGWQDVTSLSLFVDDVERLLRDLYGESDNQAIDRLLDALFVIVREFTAHLRKDLWQEHRDAEDIDYVNGMGLIEGCAIQGGDHHDANKAHHDLAMRARANPTGFSKYTLEFVNHLYANWRKLADPTGFPDSELSDEPLEEWLLI